MGTLRSLAATGDRARGFLKHRDTENTERKNEGEEERSRGRTMQGKEGWESNGGQEEWGARRVGGKKSGGKEECGERRVWGAVESMGWGCR
jgi:hypothetical protein